MKSEIEAYEEIAEEFCILLAQALYHFEEQEELPNLSPPSIYASGILFGLINALQRLAPDIDVMTFAEVLKSKLVEHDITTSDDIEYWRGNKAGEGL